MLCQKSEFKTAGRGGHRGLEERPDEAPINSDGGAGEIAGAFGSKESHDGREFLGRTETSCRNFAFPSGKDFLGLGTGARRDGSSEAVEAGRSRVPGTNIVHGDAGGSVLVGERARHAV